MNTTDTAALKPCAFCGFSACKTSGNITGTWCHVYCPNCAAEGPARDTDEEAIAAWNRRATTPQTDGATVGLTEQQIQRIAHYCETEAHACPGTNMWQCAHMAIEETLRTLAEPYLHLQIAEVCEDADGYKHIEAVIEDLDDLPKGTKLFAATHAPARTDGATVANIGSHLWMPAEIPDPTEIPLDFGTRQAYAFKQPGAGEHEPWYVVLPSAAALKLGYHADDATDRAHAEFIAAAINRHLLAATHAPAMAELLDASKSIISHGQHHDVGGGDVFISTCDAAERLERAIAAASGGEQG
jgi:hypothetical protein